MFAQGFSRPGVWPSYAWLSFRPRPRVDAPTPNRPGASPKHPALDQNAGRRFPPDRISSGHGHHRPYPDSRAPSNEDGLRAASNLEHLCPYAGPDRVIIATATRRQRSTTTAYKKTVPPESGISAVKAYRFSSRGHGCSARRGRAGPPGPRLLQPPRG